MTQNKQIKPKKNKFERTEIDGKFIETPSGFAWQEKLITYRYDKTFRAWQKDSEVITLKDVSESPLKLTKSIIAHIIFTREDEDKNKWNGINKSYWYLRLKYNIKDADNLFFTQVDGKIFIRDLHFSTCCPIALNESNENYKCTQIGEIEKITPQKASEIQKSTGTRLIFSKVETDSKGQITSFGTGV